MPRVIVLEDGALRSMGVEEGQETRPQDDEIIKRTHCVLAPPALWGRSEKAVLQEGASYQEPNLLAP